MEQKTGCLICNAPLVYHSGITVLQCSICGEKKEANAACKNAHFICDVCHSASALDVIANYCSHTEETDPTAIALTLMRHPSVKMHGPEHHFLVPAALIAAYYNITGNKEEKDSKLAQARERSKHVLGGFCGFYGTCGAGVGTGIFMSLIMNATPVSTTGWKLANQMTARSLHVIADHGGPGCCKRDSFLAIQEAVKFVRVNNGVSMTVSVPVCEFSPLNKECLNNECLYHK